MASAEPVDVLLVEDSPQDAELTLRALRKTASAHTVYHVWGGQEALDFLHSGGSHAGRGGLRLPRLVLLDLKLPQMDGLEVLSRIRSDARTRFIPVVIFTSSREPSDLLASYNLGANSYVVKPVNHVEFEETIQGIDAYWLLMNEAPQ
jgi:two-component system response regulator